MSHHGADIPTLFFISWQVIFLPGEITFYGGSSQSTSGSLLLVPLSNVSRLINDDGRFKI